jgi:hypothetical protein
MHAQRAARGRNALLNRERRRTMLVFFVWLKWRETAVRVPDYPPLEVPTPAERV